MDRVQTQFPQFSFLFPLLFSLLGLYQIYNPVVNYYYFYCFHQSTSTGATTTTDFYAHQWVCIESHIHQTFCKALIYKMRVE